LNQILRRQTSRSHHGSKVPTVTVTVFKYRNKIGKIVVKAAMHFHIVKMYKDKEVKNVKNFFVNVWRKNIFDIYVTEYGTALTTILPILFLYLNTGQNTMGKGVKIKVITKLPNSEQSYKGKVKTHNYINRQNQSTTGKQWKP
jgi:hypothetical protein